LEEGGKRVRLKTKLAIALARALAAATGWGELLDAIALPLLFLEHSAEVKRAPRRGEEEA